MEQFTTHIKQSTTCMEQLTTHIEQFTTHMEQFTTHIGQFYYLHGSIFGCLFLDLFTARIAVENRCV